jgi:hypothetical protein
MADETSWTKPPSLNRYGDSSPVARDTEVRFGPAGSPRPGHHREVWKAAQVESAETSAHAPEVGKSGRPRGGRVARNPDQARHDRRDFASSGRV